MKLQRHYPTRKPSRRTPWAAFAAMLAIAAAMMLPTGAAASTRGLPLSARSTLELPAPAAPSPDTLIGGQRRLERVTSRSSRARAFPVIGGEHVAISSTYYSDAEMQGVADVLGGLLHGPEMNTLSVYIASPDEIGQICGQGALACYAPSAGEMIVSGLDGSAYGVPRDFTIAHEYGHHIANNRLNAPWTALETGPKRWATYERVCQGSRRGQFYPGDEDYHYWDNPGEGFAESNAHLNFPAVSVPWGYNSLLRPNQASLARLQGDIVNPWSGPSTNTWNGSLWPQRRQPAQHRFPTPLDGRVEIRLSGPAASNYDLFVLGPKLGASKHLREQRRKHRSRPRRRVVDRAVSAGSEEQIDMTLCGQGSVRVEVRGRSGSGPFSVSVTHP